MSGRDKRRHFSVYDYNIKSQSDCDFFLLDFILFYYISGPTMRLYFLKYRYILMV